MKQFGARLLMIVGIILLTLGGVVLGILQYQWINQLAESERDRIRGEINKNTVHVLAATTDEVQVILSLFQTAQITENREDDPFQKIENNLFYWKKNTGYPELIVEVYMFRRSDTTDIETGEVYRFTETGFQPADMPEQIREMQKLLSTHQDPKLSEEQLHEMRKAGYVLFGDSMRRKEGMMFICKINFSILFNSIMTFYLEEFLPGYPYTIVSVDGDLIARSPEDIQDHGKPEISVPLYNFLSMSQFRLGLFPREENGMPRDRFDRPPPDLFKSRTNPLVRFWADRFSASGENPAVKAAGDPIATLNVYYPRQSLDSVITARRRANIIVSFSILAILITSIVVMYRMYVHLRLVRAKEQDFVASMSHELRTPITVIKSISQNLAEGIIAKNEKVVRYGTIIQNQSNRLSRMVEGILTYSGLISGKKLIKSETNPNIFVREIIESFASAAEQAEAEIRLYEDDSIPIAWTDTSALRIIVENLLINALRHGLPREENGYRKPYIINIILQRSRGAGPREMLRLSVEDHGEGIPQKEIRNVFAPFTRGEAAVHEQRPGSGIGLHLVKRVVGLLGGAISIESPYIDKNGIERSGCRFTVTLPLEEEHANV